MSAITNNPSPGDEYRVVTDRCELAKNSRFVVLPESLFPPEDGRLVLLQVGDKPDHLAIGRWFPEVAGCGWILMPKLWVQCTGKVSVRVLGLVIPCEDPPEDIDDLSDGERERALKIARALRN